MIQKIVFIFFVVYTSKCFCRHYHNHTLYKAVPVNDDQLQFLKRMLTKYDVNFWIEPGMFYMPCIFTISPEDHPGFIKNVIGYGLHLKTLMENVQSAFDKQTIKIYTRKQIESFNWQNYYRLDGIYGWLRDLSRIHSNSTTLETVGISIELRDILAVKVNMGDRFKSKKKVIIEGGIHAREWISPAFVTYFLNEIVNAPYCTDAKLRKIAYLYEWYFIPVLNPDGYEYTHTTDRLWRKNRRGGYGVDLNRNSGYGFGVTDGRVSFDKSSAIYCGPHAFSEPETKSLSNFVRLKSQNLEYYLSFHSFGQSMIIPYAASTEHRENYDEMKKKLNVAAQILKRRSGTHYLIGTTTEILGSVVSGITADWVKDSFQTRYVAVIELRDKGQYGFALPPSLILPTCLETMDAMLSLFTPQEEKLLRKSKNILYNSKMRTENNAFVIVFYVYTLFHIKERFDWFQHFIVLG